MKVAYCDLVYIEQHIGCCEGFDALASKWPVNGCILPVVEVLMTAATSSVWALWHINCSLEMCLTKSPMLVESPMDLWTMKQHVQIWSLGEMRAVVVMPFFFWWFQIVLKCFHSEINLGFLKTTSKPDFSNTDVS